MPQRNPQEKTFTLADIEESHAKWEEANQRQKVAINRLLGIIELARETAHAQADSPEKTLQKVQEILS